MLSTKRKIVFFVPPNVHVLDLHGPVQVFSEANEYGAQYELLFCSIRKEIKSSSGICFNHLQKYSSVRIGVGDYLFLPGAEMEYIYSREFKKQKHFLAWLRKIKKLGVTICSVSTGTFIMAEAGILIDTFCTTHWKRIKELRKLYPAAKIERELLIVYDQGIYSSASIISGIDLSLALLQQDYGAVFADGVSRELGIPYRRAVSKTIDSIYLNFRNHMDQKVHVVQNWLIENINS